MFLLGLFSSALLAPRVSNLNVGTVSSAEKMRVLGGGTFSFSSTEEFNFYPREAAPNRVVLLEAPERIPERIFLGRGLAYVLRSP